MEAFENNLSVIDPDINHFDLHTNFQSHSISSFNDKQEIEANSLKIIHHNACSLMAPGKLDQYDTLFKALKTPFDVLVFTESWLKEDNSELCKFDGFQKGIHLLRPIDDNTDFKTKGGGISIFIKDNLQFKNRDDLTLILPHMECLFIEIKYNNQNYLIGGIYRIPNTCHKSFIDQFNILIEPLKSSHKLILLGDYNIDLLKENDNYKNSFEICLQSNYLIPTIFSATRVALRRHNDEETISETLIDNIFINHNMNYHSGIIESSISDHYSIYIIIPATLTTSHTESNKIQYRLINDFRQRKFNQDFKKSEIMQILNSDNAKEAYEQFYNIFQTLYDNTFPIKTKILSPKDIQKPWVNDITIRRMKIRDNLKKLAKNKIIERKIFTSFRNKVSSELRSAKSKYFEDRFLNASNIKQTWEVINSVIRSKRTNTKVSLSDEEGNYHDESKIPSKFIEHFSSTPTNLASKIPPSQNNAASYLNDRVHQSFFIRPITPTEIIDTIDDLKDNGNKVNSVATSVLQGSKEIITPILCHLINLFVQQGYFPDNLKTGCITPIFKKGDREKVNNYRPVCSLSPLSKIIEKVINNRMVEYLDNFNLFSKTQYGFRKNMGTEDALVNYIDFLQKGLNDSKDIISVFLDLSKAFDVIDHKILAMKLEYYGFRGKFKDFLLSFIKDRKYFVNINGKNSETKTVNIGVPQGSTLGPLLFLIYINDMDSCSDKITLSQFADDSTITHVTNNIIEAIHTIEEEFDKILEWLAANKLIINLDKTHLMLFTNKKPRPKSISINAKGQTINEITETKFLGVILDNALNWNAHIQYISKKISKSVSLLKMLKFTFPTRILKSLYYSFVYPYFNYCNLIWGGAADTHIKPLVQLQKKCTRIISKVGYLDHTEPLFSELKLLNIEQIYNLNCSKFIFCSENKIKYTEFSDRIRTNGSYHRYPTSTRNELRNPLIRKTRFKKSFFNHGINMMKILPDNIKYAKSLSTFKRKIKDYTLRKCKLCKMKEIGDEFHYILICPFFVNSRRKYIKSHYRTPPCTKKFNQLLNTQDLTDLPNLMKFKDIITKYTIK